MIWWSLDTTSTWPLIYGWLSAIESRKGNVAEARRWRDHFERVSSDSSIAKISLMLGSCYTDAGLWEQGDALLRQAVSLEPKKAEFRERFGDALCTRGDTEAALHEYSISAQLNPRSMVLPKKLGNIFKQKGDTARASEQYQKYLKVDSTSYDAQQMQKWIRAMRL